MTAKIGSSKVVIRVIAWLLGVALLAAPPAAAQTAKVSWTGAEQKRPFTLTGDKLEYTVPVASGGGTGRVVWTRVK